VCAYTEWGQQARVVGTAGQHCLMMAGTSLIIQNGTTLGSDVRLGSLNVESIGGGEQSQWWRLCRE